LSKPSHLCPRRQDRITRKPTTNGLPSYSIFSVPLARRTLDWLPACQSLLVSHVYEQPYVHLLRLCINCTSNFFNQICLQISFEKKIKGKCDIYIYKNWAWLRGLDTWPIYDGLTWLHPRNFHEAHLKISRRVIYLGKRSLASLRNPPVGRGLPRCPRRSRRCRKPRHRRLRRYSEPGLHKTFQPTRGIRQGPQICSCFALRLAQLLGVG
jgi:hypothetical protein